MKQKVLVIIGQTASGKSALAVKIAKKFNGEVISADSRQVYTGLNIGTAKITERERQGVPHHLIDIANPKRKYTVALFQKHANSIIENILSKKKLPILCGGTGFYIDAITQGIILPEVPPNARLRKQLTAKTAPELFSLLKKLDRKRAGDIDKKNKVRMIRAIEIATFLGSVPRLAYAKPTYDFIKIGLRLPDNMLEKKIKLRAKTMFLNGLHKEIRKLKRLGISEKRLKEFGFEYSNPTLESVSSGTIKYAKRQITWFKRDATIKWLDPRDYKMIEKYILTKL